MCSDFEADENWIEDSSKRKTPSRPWHACNVVRNCQHNSARCTGSVYLSRKVIDARIATTVPSSSRSRTEPWLYANTNAGLKNSAANWPLLLLSAATHRRRRAAGV
eukprot:6201633-Pleurochrysis_carterae.AAC.2